MRVLVTGGTGFVGSHAVDAFVAAGHEVQLLARTPAKAEAMFEKRGTRLAAIHEGDMTDGAAVEAALVGCDAVLHAAAVVGVTAGGPAGLGRHVEGKRVARGRAV